MKYRYFLRLGFDGSQYNGWQVQKNANTVQAEVNRALSTLLREEISTTGAGRTDTGVHARVFYAHFDSLSSMDERARNQLAYKLNHLLPADIAIQEVMAVGCDGHARFDATSRTYQYIINTRKDPFLVGRAWFLEQPLKLENMQAAADMLLRHQDFSSFSKSNTQTKTNLCKIDLATWSVHDHLLMFEIRADRFLRNMVRAITGTLVDVGTGKISTADFEKIILAKDRKEAGYSAPGHGLYLTAISYPPGLWPGLG